MAAPPNPFSKATFAFLRELERHNRKDWFDPRKDRYEADVREPALAFIDGMAGEVRKISPQLRAEARRVGGSLMRVHRDVRFSTDKSPYKTNVGIQFRHVAGKDVHAPGLYVHLAPGDVFLGAGLWRPDGPALKAIREAIDGDPRGWKRASAGKAFRAHWTLEGDALKRPPRGFDADHPWVEDLKRKDFIAMHRTSEARAARKDFPRVVAERFRTAKPFLAWLTDAVGLPF